jgi:polynucleotide 5'-kinase involved in rRNA processing
MTSSWQKFEELIKQEMRKIYSEAVVKSLGKEHILSTEEDRRMPPAVSIVGKSNSGKTTLREKLVRELKLRGYRVATIKHIPHCGH